MMSETTDSEAMTQAPDLRTLSAAPSSPAWLVLDAAREQQFTGEIVFDASHSIAVYVDNGVVYHAVRDGEPSLCDQLTEAGIVDAGQISRGVVRVGAIEHLGRLFDRDPSVDRDAVTVFVEMITDALVTELANGHVGSFRVNAYRHHESGIHRWFARSGETAQLAPVGHVGPIDDSVTSKLPGLPAADRRSCPDDVRIEWDQPTLEPLAPPSPLSPADPQPLPTLDASTLESAAATDVAEGTRLAPAADEEQPDWARPVVVDATLPLLDLDDFVVTAADDGDDGEPVIAFDDDFQIVWPDGTEQDLPEAIEADQSLVETADASHDGGAGEAPRVGIDAPVMDVSPFDVPPLRSVGLAPDHGTEADATSPGDDVENDAAGIWTDTPDADAIDADQVGSERDQTVAEMDVVEPDTAGTSIDIAATEPSEAGTDDVEPDTVTASAPDAEDLSPASVGDEAPAASGDQPTMSDDAFTTAVNTMFDESHDRGAQASASEQPAGAAAQAGGLRFEMPPLVLSDDAVPTEQQPDEVIDAVRRALAAIEAASASSTFLPSMTVAGASVERDTAPAADVSPAPADALPADAAPAQPPQIEARQAESAPAEPARAAATSEAPTAADEAASTVPAEPVVLDAFAPPTPDMSAEAVYARATSEATPDAATATSGVASVVFVDDEEPEGEGEERASALRRLIGSLRRK
ncbi:MAG: hypothetical protein HKN44_14500 [Ilumatobacter sp.]|nr:hypothetical protein [Ilumatobacter sp.]